MAEMPLVTPGDWIHVGGQPGFNAVVCNVRPDEFRDFGDIEVVYLDYRDRAINVDLRWSGDRWEFATPQPDGGYADRYGRLSEYVRILRRGRYYNG